MRILQVQDYFVPGIGRSQTDACRILAERGHEVHVLAAVGRAGPKNGQVVDGLRFHTYERDEEGSALALYSTMRRNVRRIFRGLQRETKFDIVLAHQPVSCDAVADECNASIAYFFHSPWADEWSAEHADAGPLSRWFHRMIRRRVERRALAHAKVAFTRSRAMQERMLLHHPWFDRDRIQVVGAAVESFFHEHDRTASRQRLGIPAGARVLLTVRRLVPRTGVDLLLRAMAIVARELTDVILLVVGEGPMRRALEDLAVQSELMSTVRFCGFVEDVMLPWFYSAADLTVLPTRALEGFGFPILESMACGTPVAGTPVDAIPEILEPFDPRFVFREATPEAVAEGLMKLLCDERLETFRPKCVRFVNENHNARQLGDRIETTLKRLLNGPE